MRPIIKVEGLSKLYQIGAQEAAYFTLRESLMQMFKPGALRRSPKEFIWALRDFSFEAVPGDVIEGRIDLYGRVGSLLEVGTGFHPELTGRENIFLNGAILGMRRAEILRKFDEIVAFAEVAKFIDTPVKRYSSGMYLRLAFAVAAFLESEILLVDEVLAVGDANFQKKCLGKMRDVSASGRTVLFVSHNMAAVEGLCNRCLFISEGTLGGDGSPHELITRYLAAEAAPEHTTRDLQQHPGRRGGMKPALQNIALHNQTGQPSSAIRMGEGISIMIEFDCCPQPIRPNINLCIKNSYVPVLAASTRVQTQYQTADSASAGRITCELRDLPLLAGTYSIDLFFGDEYQRVDVIYDAISFEVIPADVHETGNVPHSTEGTIFWPATFEIELENPAGTPASAAHVR